jgi:uncharacterized protein
MLDGAFFHLEGIGPKKVEKFRNSGIHTWDHILDRISEISKSEKVRFKLEESLLKSKLAKEEQDLDYLTNSFHPKDKWRILDHFQSELSFFDIETDGMYNRITVIGCLHKGKNYTFVKGENLDDFLNFLDDVKIMVSFNGSSFDVPCILNYFHIPKFPVPHIDLRWVLYQLGYKGGLKDIEKRFHISRDLELNGVDGMEAVYLWFRYAEWGDKEAKDKLIKYCLADVNSLKSLTEKVILLYKDKNSP